MSACVPIIIQKKRAYVGEDGRYGMAQQQDHYADERILPVLQHLHLAKIGAH